MGAWGHHFDENDTAADWLADFEDAPSWQACQRAFDAVDTEYIEADEASTARAAAEVVAAGIGRLSERLPAEVAAWAATNAAGASAVKTAAANAVSAVRDGSELRELWDEGDADEWLATVDDLTARLN